MGWNAKASIDVATNSSNGLMSSSDKTNLDSAVDEITKMTTIRTATISTDWIGSSAPFTLTISVPGLTSDSTPIVSPVYSPDNATAVLEEKAWVLISKIETCENSIIITCFEEKPNQSINLQIVGG
jgi:hypothetical protein